MARLHEIQLGRGLRHFGQDFLARHAAAQVDTPTHAAYLNLGIHQGQEHRGDLVKARGKLLVKKSFLPKLSTRQHAGGVVKLDLHLTVTQQSPTI